MTTRVTEGARRERLWVFELRSRAHPEIWPSIASIFGQTFLQGFSHHFRLLTGCCQRFTHPPIVFLSCEANAYFIGSRFAGSLFFFSRVAALVSRVSRLCPSRARALLSLNLTKKRDCSQCKGAIFLHTKILYVTSSAQWLVQSPECEWPPDVICSAIGSKYWIGMSYIVPFVLWNLNKRILLCDWLHAISTPLTTTVAKVQ